MRVLCILLIVVSCSGVVSAHTVEAQGRSKERIAVMIYMNAKNSLDCYAVENVRQMVSALPLQNITVVIELGRQIDGDDCKGEKRENRWDGTLFFEIHKKLILRPKDALPDVPAKPAQPGTGAHIDMGDPNELRKFVRWAERRYRAEHYVLIMWGHSRGYRLTDAAAITNNDSPEIKSNGYRVVSIDNEHQSYMFTHDFRAVLEGTRKLDVFGFDSCLMAGIETAYVLSDLASVMVGSEELESDDGWNYTQILKAMSILDDRSPRRIGASIVNAQGVLAAPGGPVTLSAVDLRKIPRVANQISQLADALTAALQDQHLGPKVRSTIENIRSNFTNYGQEDGFHNPIDLLSVVTQLRDKAPTKRIHEAAARVLSSFKNRNVIFANYATADAIRCFGSSCFDSTGLTIYFPPSKDFYNRDPDDHGEAYTTCICDEPEKHPVDFVCHVSWSSFLHIYFEWDNGKTSVAQAQ